MVPSQFSHPSSLSPITYASLFTYTNVHIYPSKGWCLLISVKGYFSDLTWDPGGNQ